MTHLRRLLCALAVAVAATAPGAAAAPDPAARLSLSPALTISGDQSGYVEVELLAPTRFETRFSTIARTGRYAGVVLDSLTVLLTSDDLPETHPCGIGCVSDTRKAGTYRFYLFTEPGRYASVSIPWDAPAQHVRVGTVVDAAFEVRHAARGDLGPVVVPLPGGTRRDRVWGVAVYESRRLESHDTEIRTCLTRRPRCDRHAVTGFGSRGPMSMNGGKVGATTVGDLRGTQVIGYVESSSEAPERVLDSFSVWALRIPLQPGEDVPRPYWASERPPG